MKRTKLLKLSGREVKRSLYPRFLRLMKNGFDIEALILMLSTWNFARFRFALKQFDVDTFEHKIRELDPLFSKIKKKNFRNIDFDSRANDIKHVFNVLSKIKGIEKTGAPKLMHLKAPNVFVMWDSRIRNKYSLKNGDAQDYLDFLKNMQHEFAKTCDVNVYPNRSLPKLIDENNFIRFVKPVLRRKTKKAI